MSYKSFKEFVDLKELAMPVMNPQAQAQAGNNPANKAAVQSNLMAAMKAPAPAGVQPGMYQGKLRQALQVAKTAPVASASAAMDVTNASMRAAQQ